MGNYLVGMLVIAACLLVVAWKEYRRENRRDGGFMAGMGAIVLVSTGALSFLM